MRAEDISAVEIVGGSTRVPAVKNLIEQVFGKQASTTLNQVSTILLGKTIGCIHTASLAQLRRWARSIQHMKLLQSLCVHSLVAKAEF